MPATIAAPDLSDAALLLCAHGRSEGGEGVPEAHAAALRRRGGCAQVETCVLRGAPSIAEALVSIDAARILLVPLLMADGYTNRVLLPEMLAQAGAAARRVTLCRPVGLSPALVPLAAAEIATLCAARGWAPAETAVVVAGHGTERHAESGASADLLAGRLAALGRFGPVSAAFLEQAPPVAAALGGHRPQPCAVVGFFMDHGGHSAGDIPRLIAAAHPDAAYTGAIGAQPGFAEVILETARAAARIGR